jgi:uncharacterized protein YjbJ (UPF0337 family)
MISQKELKGGWGQLKGKIKEKWGQITDNELMQAEGNIEGLIGIIQRKTGTARREIEDFFEEAVAAVSDSASPLAAAAQGYAQQASEAVSQGYEQIADQVQKGYKQAEDLVRSRPAESLSVAFGAGIITGILTTLLIRSSR